MRLRLLIGLILLLAACSDGEPVRNPREAETVFRALIADPIPPGVRDLVSTGYVSEGGHNIYLRFVVRLSYLPLLLDRYAYTRVDCEDERIRGSLTLPQGLEDDIPDWYPFLNEDFRCYESAPAYTNAWAGNASSVLLIRTLSLEVYFNETGQD